MEDGALTLSLDPVLPGWLFDEEGKLSFTFLGNTEVIYSNPKRENTFGEKKVSIQSLMLVYRNGTVTKISGAFVRGEEAEALRRGEIAQIQAVLA
ncbi:hypothetical protein D3C76_1516670 [compost metagenome]